MTTRVLAVADSDSYLKWAAATLDGLGDGFAGRVVLVASPVLPSDAQIAAAVAGTALEPPVVRRVGRLVRRLRQDPPDALLVACTGPTARVLLALAGRVRPRPVTVVGLPGWALPASPEAVGLRRGADLFVTHSRAEQEAFEPVAARLAPGMRVVLSRLPFLPEPSASRSEPGPGGERPITRAVFAPQALVPASRPERERLLDGLGALASAGYDVVVKLRGRAAERQTHDERWPFDELAAARPGGAPGVRFETGPLGSWLTPGAALVTVSSTAALEALAAGVPVALLDDFGVRDELINTAFRGSGLLVGLGELPTVLAAGGPVADPAWLETHGLHDAPSELPEALRAAVAAGRAAGVTAPGAPALRGPADLRALARLLAPAPVAQSVRRR
ncbi:DUF6716 putative glycosyltransferase [Luteimicrobium sp. NPDC057192]|uniref:DUF6716 putative glycosyltransferase n=1 Tax=Luteimicrobium sp. NPDC057192 TaxID=3346042 RepID=UPI00363B1ADC